MLILLLLVNLFTLQGQKPALPMHLTIGWDASPGADSTTRYRVVQDTKVLGETSALTYEVTVRSLGVHTFTVTATGGAVTTAPSRLVIRVTKDSIPLVP